MITLISNFLQGSSFGETLNGYYIPKEFLSFSKGVIRSKMDFCIILSSIARSSVQVRMDTIRPAQMCLLNGSYGLNGSPKKYYEYDSVARRVSGNNNFILSHPLN